VQPGDQFGRAGDSHRQPLIRRRGTIRFDLSETSKQGHRVHADDADPRTTARLGRRDRLGPQWSGKLLGFVNDPPPDIYTMPAGGGPKTQLTFATDPTTRRAGDRRSSIRSEGHDVGQDVLTNTILEMAGAHG